MTITFNHTIVAAKDKKQSATFLTELFDLPGPTLWAHFMMVTVGPPDLAVSLDYADVADGEEIHPQHYAFLVSEDEFDAIYGRIRSWALDHWADPMGTRPGEINHNDGGRGVYFLDPAGHYMEILTRPYGSGAD
jgi:catechol 2,3-dioxygenase-like lactoylglutathione lyase family enzyme